MAENGITIEGSVDAWSQEEMKKYIDDNNICCPSCGKHDFTDIRQFNLMFKTFQGVNRGREEHGILKTGDCTGYLRKLQERTEYFQKESSVWYWTDR